jgi:hypothetical protein
MIAVSAGQARFAKLREQSLRATARRDAKPRHRPPPQGFGQGDRIVDQRPGRPPAPRQLAPVEQQQRVRRKAVAPGAADLLIIALDRIGRIGVGDEAHVRLVDAHAEGDGRHHDDALARKKRVLMRRALLAALPCVIGQRVEAEAAKIAREHIHLATRVAINDPARSGVTLHEIGELAQSVTALAKGQREVFAGEGTQKHLRRMLEQKRRDVVSRTWAGAGGHGQYRRVSQAPRQLAEPTIFGPKIMTPIRYAMGLVDREQRHARLAQEVERSFPRQPFRRHVKQFYPAGGDSLIGVRDFEIVLPRVQRRGGQPQRFERAQLIAHQRDQRRNHHHQAEPQHRRQLIQQRLSRARRHHREHVAPGQHGLQRLGLPGQKLGKSKFLAQNPPGVAEAWPREAQRQAPLAFARTPIG